MTEDTDCPTYTRCSKYRKALITDILFFVLAMLAVALGIASNDFGDLLLAVPVLAITVSALFFDHRRIRMPPTMLSMFMLSFYLSAIARMIGHGMIIDALSLLLTGMNLALLGLIIVYMMMRTMPGVRDGSPRVVIVLTMAVTMSVYTTMKLVQDLVSGAISSVYPTDPELWNYGMLIVLVGAAIVCTLYRMFPDRGLFKYTVSDFLLSNSDVIGIEGAETDAIHRIIEVGESDTTEFNSTIRTNLETGEVDKRMEKAVLKTLVAFMNTDGGTLLVGVSDNGDIRGLDIESFDNTDKLYLHFTNIVAAGIGNGLLPFINFRLVDFGQNKYVLRVVCRPSPKPVFFKDGKLEQFYVRSGPSSVELTGMSMVKYINNMSKKGKRHMSDE